jgi:integrase
MKRMSSGGAAEDGRTPKNRPNDRGLLRFDRQFPKLGVPRFQLSSGTRDPDEFRKRNGYLTQLAAMGRAEELKAFASGEITIEHIEKAFATYDVSGFLAKLRAERPVSPTVVAASMALLASGGGHQGAVPAGGPNAKLDAPLWGTALEEVIPAMGELEPDSRRRYATSIGALKTKAAVMAADDDVFEEIASIDPTHWEALERARMRAVGVARLRELVKLPAQERRAALRETDTRVGEEVFTTLRSLPASQWRALAVADRIVSENVVRTLERMKGETRVAVRAAARKLGRDATIGDLGSLTAADWKNLSRAWGESGTDWNHLRRALSAVLTTYFGTVHHELRRSVIERIPLQPEVERTPDLSATLFWQIVPHLPEELRPFPVVLVLTGMRMKEYQGTDRSALRAHSCTIRVAGKKTPGSDDWVHVDPQYWSYIDAGVPAFRSYARLRSAWKGACAVVGVEGVTLHDLRHCHGQWGLEGGAPEPAIQVSLRHKTAGMTRRYTKKRQRDQVARAIGGVLRESESD